MKKRLLSALMVFCMVLTLLPVSAFAAPNDTEFHITGIQAMKDLVAEKLSVDAGEKITIHSVEVHGAKKNQPNAGSPATATGGTVDHGYLNRGDVGARGTNGKLTGYEDIWMVLNDASIIDEKSVTAITIYAKTDTGRLGYGGNRLAPVTVYLAEGAITTEQYDGKLITSINVKDASFTPPPEAEYSYTVNYYWVDAKGSETKSDTVDSGTDKQISNKEIIPKSPAEVQGYNSSNTYVLDTTKSSKDFIWDTDKQIFDVYYAVDANNNTIPDYRETTYELTYDVNEATGSVTDSNKYYAGAQAVLNEGTELDATNEGITLLGWSLTDNAYTATSPATQTPSDLTLLEGFVTFETANITVYAVWAEDTNDNNKPDYEETPAELGWPINVSFCDPETLAAIVTMQSIQKDGAATPPTSNGDKEITGWTLDTAGQTAYDSDTFTYSELAELVDNAKGWSECEKKGYLTLYAVYAEEPVVDPDTPTVYHVMNTDGVLDKVLQATWPETDVNQIQLSNFDLQTTNKEDPVNGWSDDHGHFIVNNKLSETGEGISYGELNSVTLCGENCSVGITNFNRVVERPDENGISKIHVTYDLMYNINDGIYASRPAMEQYKQVSETYTLSNKIPTHSAVDGKDVVFIGWTTEVDETIYSFTNRDSMPETVTEVTVDPDAPNTDNFNLDVNVYALWGYDENGDGVADALQQKVNLVIYRDGNTKDAYKSVSLGYATTGDSYPLTGLKIADYYTPNNFAVGYEFEGWYNDGGWNQYEDGDPDHMLGDSITINGWTNIICMVWDQYNVNYSIDGERVHQDIFTKAQMDNYSLWQPAEKDGYSFDGWYEKESDIGDLTKKLDGLNSLKKYELYGAYVAETPETKEVTLNFYDEVNNVQVKEEVISVPADATHVNTSKITVPDGYELVQTGDLPINDGYVYVAVKPIETPETKDVTLNFYDEVNNVQVKEEVISVPADATHVNTSKITVPDGYELVQTGDLPINDGYVYVAVKPIETPETKDVTLNFYDEVNNVQVKEEVISVPADATHVNTSKITVPDGYELVQTGDLPINDGYVYVAVKPIETPETKDVTLNFYDEVNNVQVKEEDISVPADAIHVNTSKITVPDGYELVQTGDLPINDGYVYVAVKPIETPETKDVTLNFYDEVNNVQVKEEVISVPYDAIHVNTSKITVPDGYELVQTGDLPINDGYVYVAVKPIETPETKDVTLNFYDEVNNVQVKEEVISVPYDAIHVNTSKITVPDGYELVQTGDLPINDGYVYVAVKPVEKPDDTVIMNIRFVLADGTFVGGGDYFLPEGVQNLSILEQYVPVGYEMAETGDFMVTDGGSRDVRVEKLDDTVIMNIRFVLADGTFVGGGDYFLPEGVQNLSILEQYVPVGYEMAETGDFMVTDGGSRDVRVEKLDDTVIMNIRFVLADGTFVGGGDYFLPEGVQNLSILEQYVPVGYEMAETGDFMVTDGGSRDVRVEKLDDTVIMNIRFVLADGTFVGGGDYFLPEGVQNLSILEQYVPVGYEMAETGDFMVTNGGSRDVRVEKLDDTVIMNIRFVLADGTFIAGGDYFLPEGIQNMSILEQYVPEGYKMMESGDFFVTDGGQEDITVEKISKDVIMNIRFVLADGTFIAGGDYFLPEGIQNMSILEQYVPEGYKMMESGDFFVTDGGQEDITVEKISKDVIMNIRFVLADGTFIAGGDYFLPEGIQNMSILEQYVPEGYKMMESGDFFVTDGGQEDITVEKISKDVIMNIRFVLADGTFIAGGDYFLPEGIQNMSILEQYVPEGYKMMESGDFFVTDGGQEDITVEKISKDVIMNIRFVLADGTFIAGGDYFLPEGIQNMSILEQYVPEGYKMMESGDFFVTDGGQEDITVEKIAEPDTQSVTVTYWDTTNDKQVGESFTVAVAADATNLNTSVLTNVPEGYELVWTGDLAIENGAVRVEVRPVTTPPVEKTFTVTFDSNGGSAVASQTVKEGEKAVKPANPTRSNYTFEGWFTDETLKNAYDFNTPVTGDITLYADWDRRSSGGGGGGGSTSTKKYTITVICGKGGEITPDGGSDNEVEVPKGNDQTFRISADNGYRISDVLVDGESVGSVDKYTFKDVDEDHEIEAIFARRAADPSDSGTDRYLNTEDHVQYMTGYPDGTFGPSQNMTRAEAAQMFYALLLDKNVAHTVSFSDVPADAWYAEAVNTLASLGMINGYPDGTFRPDAPITRAEFCVIALAFAYEPEDFDCDFRDVSTRDWFYDYVAQATSYGWISGSDRSFRPNECITRAEVSVIVNNMLGRVADEDYIDRHEDELNTFPDVKPSHWAYYSIMETANSHDFTKRNGNENWR